MMYTTIPSFIIAIVIFFFLGFNIETSTTQNINDLLFALESKININYYLFIVPLVFALRMKSKLLIEKDPDLSLMENPS